MIKQKVGIIADTFLGHESHGIFTFIPIPNTHLLVQILTISVTLQLLAYHTACALQRDVDKPRNLAKSVTVE